MSGALPLKLTYSLAKYGYHGVTVLFQTLQPPPPPYFETTCTIFTYLILDLDLDYSRIVVYGGSDVPISQIRASATSL
jgi:hypothetical protein